MSLSPDKSNRRIQASASSSSTVSLIKSRYAISNPFSLGTEGLRPWHIRLFEILFSP